MTFQHFCLIVLFSFPLQLYGAVAMNGTLSLGIFFALIAFRGLSWTFSAEVIAIVFAILAVGIPCAIFRTFPLIWVVYNIPIYPLAVFMVWALETWAKWN